MASSHTNQPEEHVDSDVRAGEPMGSAEPTFDETGTVNGPEEQSLAGQSDPSTILSAALAPDEIGRLGHYRILAKLGVGGMGVVFLGEDLKLERRAALKMMKPGLAASEKSRERFLREARAAASVQHDHVMPILHIDDEHEAPFFAMPYLEGCTLADLLASGETLPLLESMRIARETASGLAAAHARGLIHRDIKPSNIWLEGPARRVRILDFGLARQAFASNALTSHGQLIGTPAYMAPEQAAAGTVDQRADLFSLGAVIYRMVAGVQPFQGADIIATLSQLATKDVPPLDSVAAAPSALSLLTGQLLNRDPQRRPADAQAVVDQLTAIEARLKADGTSMTGQRRWIVAAFLAAGLLATALVVRYGHRQGIHTNVNPPVAAMPPRTPREQLVDVVAELLRRNPHYDGSHQPQFVDGKLRSLRITSRRLTDLTPLAALTDLRSLAVLGKVNESSDLASIEGLRGLQLNKLDIGYHPKIVSLDALRGMPLEDLSIFQTSVRDLSPLRGMKLKTLCINWTKVVDMEPLRGMPLNALIADHSGIASVEPLRKAPLRSLYIAGAQVRDLSPLVDCPLELLVCDFDHRRDGAVLRQIKSLARINHRPAAEMLNASNHVIAAAAPRPRAGASVAERTKQLKIELKRRNPKFDGELTVWEKNGGIDVLWLPTHQLVDLGPLASITELKTLRGNATATKRGGIVDLRPLRELRLTELCLGWNPIRDLAPLRSMKLQVVDLYGTEVDDLSALAGMPIRALHIGATKVTRLDPIAGAPLEFLSIHGLALVDLEVLAGRPLREIHLDHSANAERLVRQIQSLRSVNRRPVPEFFQPPGQLSTPKQPTR